MRRETQLSDGRWFVSDGSWFDHAAQVLHHEANPNEIHLRAPVSVEGRPGIAMGIRNGVVTHVRFDDGIIREVSGRSVQLR